MKIVGADAKRVNRHKHDQHVAHAPVRRFVGFATARASWMMHAWKHILRKHRSASANLKTRSVTYATQRRARIWLRTNGPGKKFAVKKRISSFP
jgi:hypothetical protein